MLTTPAITLPSGEFMEHVIPELLAWRRQGLGGALVTLVGVEGSSPRPVGSQMAVSANGQFAGQISSGCAEAVIVAHAIQSIEENTARLERYGRGSNYFDIRLPCGSGIDVWYDPAVPQDVLEEIAEAGVDRRPVRFEFSHGAGVAPLHTVMRLPIPDSWTDNPAAAGRVLADRRFARDYAPRLRLVIGGRGPTVALLARMASLLDWDVVVASPEEETLRQCATPTAQLHHLANPDAFDASCIDSWTACVLLFHDHEWEPAILSRVLRAPAFYVGALGSRKTHALRREALVTLGCTEPEIARVRGPVGLDIGARNPPELALAIAGEILAAASAGRAGRAPSE